MPCMLQPDPARPIGRRERCLPARSRLGYVRAIHPPLHIDRMRMRLCAVFFLCSALVRVRVVCTIIFFTSSLAHTPPPATQRAVVLPHSCSPRLRFGLVWGAAARRSCPLLRQWPRTVPRLRHRHHCRAGVGSGTTPVSETRRRSRSSHPARLETGPTMGCVTLRKKARSCKIYWKRRGGVRSVETILSCSYDWMARICRVRRIVASASEGSLTGR